MATQARPAALISSDPIVDWRLEQLMAAGYSSDDALLLAVRNEIDLHRAVALLRSGCSAETAVRILL